MGTSFPDMSTKMPWGRPFVPAASAGHLTATGFHYPMDHGIIFLVHGMRLPIEYFHMLRWLSGNDTKDRQYDSKKNGKELSRILDFLDGPIGQGQPARRAESTGRESPSRRPALASSRPVQRRAVLCNLGPLMLPAGAGGGAAVGQLIFNGAI